MLSTDASLLSSPPSLSRKMSEQEQSANSYFEKLNYMLLYNDIYGDETVNKCPLLFNDNSGEEDEIKKQEFLSQMHIQHMEKKVKSLPKRISLKSNFTQIWKSLENDSKIEAFFRGLPKPL